MLVACPDCGSMPTSQAECASSECQRIFLAETPGCYCPNRSALLALAQTAKDNLKLEAGLGAFSCNHSLHLSFLNLPYNRHPNPKPEICKSLQTLKTRNMYSKPQKVGFFDEGR